MSKISNFWTQEQAIELCRKIESIAPLAGCHVALTGGCLYKDDLRKDVDILFYRIRQVDEIDAEMLDTMLSNLGIKILRSYGWVRKAEYQDKAIDLFFPEEKHISDASEYNGDD